MFFATVEVPFNFGREDAQDVVGLDARDMGISAIAGSIEAAWGVWWLVNQSGKRHLLLVYPDSAAPVRIAPQHRHALTVDRISILVPGVISTHELEIGLPVSYLSYLHEFDTVSATGTITGAEVAISERERDALTALFVGYLEPFPRQTRHPRTYAEAARLLCGPDWSADRIRKAVERVKERFAVKHGLYFNGPLANYELADHLIANSILTIEDLKRLRRQDP